MITPSKYLDVSTAHVKPETANPACPKYLIAEYEYGAFYYVPDVIEEDTPPDLAAVLQYAYDNGCELVRFDRDSLHVNDLKTYDW